MSQRVMLPALASVTYLPWPEHSTDSCFFFSRLRFCRAGRQHGVGGVSRGG